MATSGLISSNLSLHPLLHTHLPTLTNTRPVHPPLCTKSPHLKSSKHQTSFHIAVEERSLPELTVYDLFLHLLLKQKEVSCQMHLQSDLQILNWSVRHIFNRDRLSKANPSYVKIRFSSWARRRKHLKVINLFWSWWFWKLPPVLLAVFWIDCLVCIWLGITVKVSLTHSLNISRLIQVT